MPRYTAEDERRLAEELLEDRLDEPWQARITQTGRFTWNVDYTKGLMGLMQGSFVIGGERMAERVARRRLARLCRQDERAKKARVIS